MDQWTDLDRRSGRGQPDIVANPNRYMPIQLSAKGRVNKAYNCQVVFHGMDDLVFLHYYWIIFVILGGNERKT